MSTHSFALVAISDDCIWQSLTSTSYHAVKRKALTSDI